MSTDFQHGDVIAIRRDGIVELGTVIVVSGRAVMVRTCANEWCSVQSDHCRVVYRWSDQ
jgi:hypothetical protein